MLKYAALIVTFNRKDKLVKALDAVLNQSIEPTKVILVDNASTDGTQEMLGSLGYLDNERVQFIKLPTNIGGSGGFYEAFEAALKLDVDWVSIADDDAIYEPGYFEKMAAAMERHPDAGGFTGQVKVPDGRTDITHRFRFINDKILKWREVPLEEYTTDFVADVFTFVGSFLSMATIKKVGLPEKDYFIWWDDLDYSTRVHKVAKVYNVPGAIILHDTDLVALDSLKTYTPDWRAYYGVRNMYFTFWKNAQTPIKYPYFILKLGRTWFNLISPRIKGYRGYETLIAFEALKDFIRGKKGLNEKFLPGSSKKLIKK